LWNHWRVWRGTRRCACCDKESGRERQT
jgi:hypothetical protein